MSSYSRRPAVIAISILFTAGSACTESPKAPSCPPGYSSCNGRCYLTNEAECGCVAGLRAPLPDSWGAMWDGLERQPTTLAAARESCEAIGGRLPTATELFRVSAAQSGEVGQSYQTNPLWSLVPMDATSQFTVRLDTGAAGAFPATQLHQYRCVCSPPLPDSFSGRACHGPPGSECFTLPSGPQITGKERYHLDASDRVPLPKLSALWECGFYRGRLPEYLTYVEAIRFGLPNGSAAFLHSADDVHFTVDAAVKWSGNTATWSADGSSGTLAFSTAAPFRCVGLNVPKTRAASSTQWTNPKTGITADAADQTASPSSLLTAIDTCWSQGGHLARASELVSLIQGGLPAGSGNWLWTADQTGYDNTNFTVEMLNWKDASLGFTWKYKHDPTNPFRCIYYPIDDKYVPPTQCAGPSGCVKLQLPNSTATVWMDSGNRSPALLASAIQDCALLGGHLATDRDYTEAIRNSLPNGAGSGVWIMTSDLSLGAATSVLFQVVAWTGTEPTFTDLYPNYSTWQAISTAAPYRCSWTNELR